MKVTIEVHGRKLVIDEAELDLSLQATVAEMPCDCPDGCGAVHRTISGPYSFALVGQVPQRPLWRAA